MSIMQICKDREAFETPAWAIRAMLEVELLTQDVLDPCAGLGAIGYECEMAGIRGDRMREMDIEDWNRHFPGTRKRKHYIIERSDFLTRDDNLWGVTVVMNPPFSLAERFVDHSRVLGARKIVCFQRQAWRESIDRREWWEKNPPARVWVCGARATCWRFDLLECHDPRGESLCANARQRGKKHETAGCSKCMGNSPTSNAWYVWEQGHKGAEVTSAIYPPAKESK